MVEDCACFLKIIEDLKSYKIEFEEDGNMKAKVYPDDYAVESQNWQAVIVITYDKCTFSANNDV